MPTADASINFLNLYSLQQDFGAYVDAWIIAEFENTGTLPITAFKGKWKITDDLDETLAEQDIRFTSDTAFVTAEGDKSPHVIAPGEKFLIITLGVRGQDDKVFATTKEAIGSVIAKLTVADLESHRIKKKITFTAEKIVNP
jgi:hypothetical protein